LVTAGNGIDVTSGDVDITDNLNVTGNLNADGTVNLSSTGLLTTVEGMLLVNEQADFDGNLDANAGLDVTGGSLTVDNQAITQTTGGQVTFAGNVDAQSGLDVTGALTVSTDATITGNTRVDGNFQFDAAGQTVDNIRTDVRATGLTDNVSLVTESGILSAISGGVTADNGLNEDPDGNIQLGGPLTENTTITNDGFDLVLDGATGDVTFDSDGLVTAGNGIDVTSGDVDITDNLNVTGNLNADGTVNLSSTGLLTTVESRLLVNEQADFDGNLDANAGLDVTGLLQADDNVTLGSDNTDALVVNATADFNDYVNIDGNLDANNGIDLTSGDLTVADNAIITGNTRVDGNFQFDAAGQAVDNIRTDVRATGLTDDLSLVTESGIRSAISGGVTADNGLNEDPDGNIQLGGPLTENTTITSDGFDLVLDGATGDVTFDSDG
ncbi:MAG: hypothetical protein LC650_05615, partial [Actinobacteria bacterium]|nr:hypothetical protein [Actinomycetota bacterium]